MLETIYAGFSHPDAELDPDFRDVIAVEHARGVVSGFLSRAEGELGRGSDSLLPTITSWLGFDATIGDVWNPAFGAAELAMRSGTGAHLLIDGAQLALKMHATGLTGHWRARLDQPARLTFDRWCLPQHSALEVDATGENVTIRVDSAADTPFAFRRAEQGWEHDRGADELRRVPVRDRWITFATDSVLDGRYEGDIPFARAAVGDEVLAAWRSGIDLVECFASGYLPWIEAGVGTIIPLDAPPGAMVSGSNSHRVGEIFATAAMPAATIGEMLVHESSHQQFMLAEQLASVDDGSDTRMYYSPVVDDQRPIARILFAYHAFSNVLLFHRACRAAKLPEHGLDTPEKERWLLEQLEMLSEPLHRTRALTELGVSIWQPLAARLEETR